MDTLRTGKVWSIKLNGSDYCIRDTTPADVATVASHRQQMFLALGKPPDGNLALMATEFVAWLRPKLRDREYVGWLAELEGAVVAGIGVFLVRWPPHPSQFGPLRGYVMNAFTEPGHRDVGISDYLLRIARQFASEKSASRSGRPAAEFEPLGHEGRQFAGAKKVP